MTRCQNANRHTSVKILKQNVFLSRCYFKAKYNNKKAKFIYLFLFANICSCNKINKIELMKYISDRFLSIFMLFLAFIQCKHIYLYRQKNENEWKKITRKTLNENCTQNFFFHAVNSPLSMFI